MIGTMVLYAVGTAACAVAPNIWVLLACRVVAALGIGGEWAAGASMVAEAVPEKRRVEAGALLYSSAPLGLFLATFVNWLVAGVLLPGDPGTSWRWVFAFGILPAGVAILVRRGLHEPERFTAVAASPAVKATFAELWSPAWRRHTLSGLAMAVTAMLTWWACNAFIPLVAGGLGDRSAVAAGLTGAARQGMVESSKTMATNLFNLGGLVGTFITVPIAKRLGRRPMYGIYFALSALALVLAFGVQWPESVRLWFYFPVGMTVFGVFGSFTYYLPELFPTRLRGTGAGFCYNAGRTIAAVGPFVVGSVASKGADALATAFHLLSWVAVVPLFGLLALPWVMETRGRELVD
jgi:MFS family permease